MLNCQTKFGKIDTELYSVLGENIVACLFISFLLFQLLMKEIRFLRKACYCHFYCQSMLIVLC